ncbi:hypothetical protein TSOC_012427 [Tetrabaena socialis]|uniref:Uncharacterized protein n=1 Tax=Tetrabaena socialis TaxID=47790 RepID=A0A2J7ZN21_9CHLO|nr:hypothetical protein TSOC_012427 [Tetrabaena socialis]|eukprot:PNH01672.1 hypothetical protein TSOC_012427 [Tetrabaena socialis]
MQHAAPPVRARAAAAAFASASARRWAHRPLLPLLLPLPLCRTAAAVGEAAGGAGAPATEGAEYGTVAGPLGEAAMRRMASGLRINQPGRHLFLCADQTVAKCCSKEDGIRSWDYLKKRCKVVVCVWGGGPEGELVWGDGLEWELGLEAGEAPFWRTKANCLRICAMGPIAVVYPEQGSGPR